MPDHAPEWLDFLAREVARLARTSQPLDPAAHATAQLIGLCLESDRLPRPGVSILNRKTLRLVWSRNRRLLILDVRACRFTLAATLPDHEIPRADMAGLAWLDPLRRALAWVHPEEMRGRPLFQFEEESNG